MVVERFTRQLALLTGSRGRLSGEVGVGGCEMTDADELERADALGWGELRERALCVVAAVGEEVFVDVALAFCAQVLRRR
jgi:hypothetical protein